MTLTLLPTPNKTIGRRLLGALGKRSERNTIMPPSASTAHGLVALAEILAEKHGGERDKHLPAAIDIAMKLSERGWALTKDAAA